MNGIIVLGPQVELGTGIACRGPRAPEARFLGSVRLRPWRCLAREALVPAWAGCLEADEVSSVFADIAARRLWGGDGAAQRSADILQGFRSLVACPAIRFAACRGGAMSEALPRRLAAVVFASLLQVTAAAAQDRLPPIPPEKYDDAQKKAAAEFLAVRKVPVFGPFEILIR